MSASTAAYVVERKKTDEGEWSPVVYCQSLEYAQIIALIGVARRIAILYRAIDLHTGTEAMLFPKPGATAAISET